MGARPTRISELPLAEYSTIEDEVLIQQGGKSKRVSLSKLPSYVDDVIEGYLYNNKFYSDSQHTKELTPEESKIYVDLVTNFTYRWGGSVYVKVGGDEQVQSDWTETNTVSPAYIRNKPDVPAGQVASDWNQTNSSNVDFIKNKPFDVATVVALATQTVTYSGAMTQDLGHTCYSVERDDAPYGVLPLGHVSISYAGKTIEDDIVETGEMHVTQSYLDMMSGETPEFPCLLYLGIKDGGYNICYMYLIDDVLPAVEEATVDVSINGLTRSKLSADKLDIGHGLENNNGTLVSPDECFRVTSDTLVADFNTAVSSGKLIYIKDNMSNLTGYLSWINGNTAYFGLVYGSTGSGSDYVHIGYCTANLSGTKVVLSALSDRLVYNIDNDTIKVVQNTMYADIKAFRPFPNGTITASTLSDLKTQIMAFPTKAQGRAYAGEVTGSCLPAGLANAELTVCFVTSSIAVLTCYSSNVYPYHWECNTAETNLAWKPYLALPTTKPNDFNSSVYDIRFTNGSIGYAKHEDYDLPAATASTLGGVKIGTGVNVENDGTISVTMPEPYTLPTASANTLGGVKIGNGINIDDGVISTQEYSLPTATDEVLGGVKVGTNLSISEGVLSATDTTYSAGTGIDISNQNEISVDATELSYNDLQDKPTIDSELSSSSTNAVQNKVVKARIDNVRAQMTPIIGPEPIPGVSTIDITTSTGDLPPVYDYAGDGYDDVLVFAYSGYATVYNGSETLNLLVTVGLNFISGRASLDDVEFVYKSSNGALSGSPGIYAKTKSGNAIPLNFSYSVKSYYFSGAEKQYLYGGYRSEVQFFRNKTFNGTLNSNEIQVIELFGIGGSYDIYCKLNMGSYGYFNYFSDLSTMVVPSITVGAGATQWPANFIFNGQVPITGWEEINDKVSSLEASVVPATSSTLGLVQPDNDTISIDNNGVISSNISTFIGMTPEQESIDADITSTDTITVDVDVDTFKAKYLTDVGTDIVDGDIVKIKYNGTDWIVDTTPASLDAQTIVIADWGITITGTVTLDDIIVFTYNYSDATAGDSGLVPAPTASDNNKYLKSNGTWGTIIAPEQEQADWDENDNTAKDYIKNKPTIPVIDTELSTTSTNAVQNKLVTNRINDVRSQMSAVIGAEQSSSLPTIDITTSNGKTPPVYDFASDGYTDVITLVWNAAAYSHVDMSYWTVYPLMQEIGIKFTNGRPSLDNIEFFVEGKNQYWDGNVLNISAKTKDGSTVTLSGSYLIKTYKTSTGEIVTKYNFNSYNGSGTVNFPGLTETSFNINVSGTGQMFIPLGCKATMSNNSSYRYQMGLLGDTDNIKYLSELSTILIPTIEFTGTASDWNANFTFNGAVVNPWLDIQDRVSDLENATLPIASAGTLGAIKVGTNLSIDANGILSSALPTLPVVDGEYMLKCTVVSGVPTLSWVQGDTMRTYYDSTTNDLYITSDGTDPEPEEEEQQEE